MLSANIIGINHLDRERRLEGFKKEIDYVDRALELTLETWIHLESRHSWGTCHIKFKMTGRREIVQCAGLKILAS
jgi:hypothetical protein